MEKIKISFEPTDIWNHEDFRNLIKSIKQNKYSEFEYELWIITTNQSLNYINAIANELEIPNERVLMCLNDTSKIELIVLNSDIHLDGENIIIHDLENSGTHGILVDRKIAYSAIGLKYVKILDTWTTIIIRERNGEKTKPC